MSSKACATAQTCKQSSQLVANQRTARHTAAITADQIKCRKPHINDNSVHLYSDLYRQVLLRAQKQIYWNSTASDADADQTATESTSNCSKQQMSIYQSFSLAVLELLKKGFEEKTPNLLKILDAAEWADRTISLTIDAVIISRAMEAIVFLIRFQSNPFFQFYYKNSFFKFYFENICRKPLLFTDSHVKLY